MTHYKISDRVSHLLIFYLLVFDRVHDTMCLNKMSRTSSRNMVKVKVTWHTTICLLPIQGAHTKQWTHTHREHTSGAAGSHLCCSAREAWPNDLITLPGLVPERALCEQKPDAHYHATLLPGVLKADQCSQRKMYKLEWSRDQGVPHHLRWSWNHSPV